MTWYSSPAPVTPRVQAYFAPVNRTTQTPVLFDSAELGSLFDVDSPPSPWISLGWIKGFERTPASKSTAVLTGIPAAPLEQVRETLQAQVSFQFLSWTKLTMALATGSQHMNLLAPASGANASADGATAIAAIAVQSGSTSTSIVLSSTDVPQFSAGEIVAIDVDYSGQTGYVGSPVSGAYVKTALTDVDYVRRVTFNIGLVSSVTSSGLTLLSALPGGAPSSSAKVQRVIGFLDREGGSFYQEWSALFVEVGSQGERIYYHYPRLQSMASAEEIEDILDAQHKDGLYRVVLKAKFCALPVTDALDGERVVCYRSFIPVAGALV
jgi:hypothetical protein